MCTGVWTSACGACCPALLLPGVMPLHDGRRCCCWRDGCCSCCSCATLHDKHTPARPPPPLCSLPRGCRCAYAHGTSALRTHLINMTPKQTQLTWPVFSALRRKWAGKVRGEQWGAWGGRLQSALVQL